MKKGIERLGRDITMERAQRGCFGKKPFDSRNAARDWSKVGVKMFGNAATEPYHCHVCGRWHLTKLDKQGQSVARAKNWKAKP